MEYISVTGESRTVNRSKGAKQLRAAGKVPCVLYGLDENLHFSVEPLKVRDLIYTPEFRLADLEINGKSYKAIVKDVSFHPVSEQILHIDFLALQENRPIKVSIPVELTGKPQGVIEGGTLIPKMRKINLKCTPEKLIDKVQLDVSSLRIGEVGRVGDLEIDDSIAVLDNPASPIALIKRPRVAVTVEEDEDDDAPAGEDSGEAAAE